MNKKVGVQERRGVAVEQPDTARSFAALLKRRSASKLYNTDTIRRTVVGWPAFWRTASAVYCIQGGQTFQYYSDRDLRLLPLSQYQNWEKERITVIHGILFKNHIKFLKHISKKSKGKAVPLQAWSGPEGSRKFRFPDFMTTAQAGGKVVSLTHRPPLPPGNTPGTYFC